MSYTFHKKSIDRAIVQKKQKKHRRWRQHRATTILSSDLYCVFDICNLVLFSLTLSQFRVQRSSPPASLNLWSHQLFLDQRRRPQQRCLHHHYQCYLSYFAVMLKLISGYYDCKIEDTWPTAWKNGRHFAIPGNTYYMDTSPYSVIRVLYMNIGQFTRLRFPPAHT